MFHNKKCFTIESLVGKEASNHPGTGTGSGGSGDEPIRPTALRFPESLHPSAAAAAAAAGVFGSCFQGSSGRTLYPAGPDMVLQEPGTHAHSPGGLPLHPLQIPPPQSFFSPQHRDALSFYPWVLRSRYLGHRFTGQTPAAFYSAACSVFNLNFISDNLCIFYQALILRPNVDEVRYDVTSGCFRHLAEIQMRGTMEGKLSPHGFMITRHPVTRRPRDIYESPEAFAGRHLSVAPPRSDFKSHLGSLLSGGGLQEDYRRRTTGGGLQEDYRRTTGGGLQEDYRRTTGGGLQEEDYRMRTTGGLQEEDYRRRTTGGLQEDYRMRTTGGLQEEDYRRTTGGGLQEDYRRRTTGGGLQEDYRTTCFLGHQLTCLPLCLCLSPVCLQVKVWFQNRRTKHKRQKLEEETPEAQQKRKGSQHVNRWRAATQQPGGGGGGGGAAEDVDVLSED
ncbi:uncharacterized protein LOC121947795 [Plectropomus leopardus]|uniref:uncharacterized protein LOC121947795 n=1 Tax=Plectropomus leopardus TaxID=160734 RepID=UPI001C4DB2A3|nr:uncharacterized protein LOC121947795 [Plectropomus leopardus]